MLKKSAFFSLLLCSVISFISTGYSQEITDSNQSQSFKTDSFIVAPDNSVRLGIDKFGFTELYINGSWNRLKEDLLISDRSNQYRVLDFGFGTYTDLQNGKMRLSYDFKTSSNSVAFYSKYKSLNVSRTITLLSNGKIEQHISLSNTTDKNISLDTEGLAFSMSSLVDIARIANNNNNILEYKYFNGKKIEKARSHGGSFFSGSQPMDFIKGAEWLTIADNFFMFLVFPNTTNTVTIYNGLEFGKNPRMSLGTQVLATNIQAHKALDLNMNYYIGPRFEKTVVAEYPQLKKLFAWPAAFNWLLKPIENGTYWILNSLELLTGSPGLTLILIALLVKLLLLPLSIKSAISMKKMRMLQPKLNKLQEKWGYDPQLLQQKTMELYRQEKANPLGGCLPLLLQIPVFFALFRVLSRSVQLRGASFLWIHDLTMADSLFMIGTFSFNLLPIIMTALQLVSVFLQQGRVGDSQNDMQKQMQTQSYLMPLIFLFLFWNMPSGLVLYWTVQNVFSIVEQEFINLDARLGKQ